MTFPVGLSQHLDTTALPATRTVEAQVTHIWRDTTAATYPSTATGKLMSFNVDIDVEDLVDGELQAEECKVVDAYVFNGHVYLAIEVEGV